MTDTSGDDKMYDTVAKLLRKAESTENEKEAEIFFAKAQELITRNALNMMALHDRVNGGDGKVEDIGDEFIKFTSVFFNEDARLWVAVAKANSCKVLIRDWGKNEKGIVLIGRESDRKNVQLLVTSLQFEVARRTRTLPAELRDAKAFDKFVWRRSWREGFSHTIGVRLAEAMRASAQTYKAGDRLPMLLDHAAAVQDYVSKKFNVSQGVSRNSRFNASGAAAGSKAAKGVDVGGPRVGAKISGALGKGKG